jgi:hypothetical protein
VRVQEIGDGSDKPFAVRTTNQQDGAMCHLFS